MSITENGMYTVCVFRRSRVSWSRRMRWAVHGRG